MLEFNEANNVPGYKILAPDFDVISKSGLPESFSGWCTWKAETRAGQVKPAKAPFGLRKRLSVSKPEEWLSFGAARSAFEHRGFDGVGLLMSSSSDCIVGFDLDKCLALDGSILPDRKAIVADFLALGSYTEVSPSGTGLRQFLKGMHLDEYKQKSSAQNLEVYESYEGSDVRYLTVTGMPYPIGSEPLPVIWNNVPMEKFIVRYCERHPEAEPIDLGDWQGDAEGRSVSEVLILLKERNKRGRVSRLLLGDCTGYPGQSEADLALCCEIAYYCRNPATIDAVMRQSGLMRPKFDSKRGKSTYGAGTIKKALASQTKFFDIDQVEKVESKAVAQGVAKAEQDTIEAHLIGGGADLKRGKGFKTDIYSITELLIRDRRLLGVIFFDEFSGFAILTRSLREVFDDPTAPETIGRLTDAHLRCVVRWLGKSWGINLRPEQALGIVESWSQKIRRNPAIERLKELHAAWDKKPRLENWLATYFDAKCITDEGTDITGYLQTVGPRWLISAVARAMKPGCKADCMLILEGKQGARKSSGVRVLAEALSGDYFREGFSLESGGKDDRIALRGRIVIEWAELAGLGKKDMNQIKNFLSQQVDSYRAIYGLTETDWQRTAVFVGTTNEQYYLSDNSGGRRFWPVKVGRIDLERLRLDAGQLWGEAVAMYKAGAAWWIDDSDPRDQRILQLAAGEQDRRLSGTVWQETAADVGDHLVMGVLKLIDDVEKAKAVNHFSVEQMKIWLAGSVDGAAKFDNSLWLQVVDGLRRAGFESRRISGRMRWQLTDERLDDLCQKLEVARPRRSRN